MVRINLIQKHYLILKSIGDKALALSNKPKEQIVVFNTLVQSSQGNILDVSDAVYLIVRSCWKVVVCFGILMYLIVLKCLIVNSYEK